MAKPEAEELTFAVAGSALVGRFHDADRRKPLGAVLLVHGFNSNVTEFGHLPARLAKAGYASLAFDQRGFGGSGGAPGRTSPDRCLEDIRGAVAEVRKRVPKGPLGVVGHSLGGAWALYAMTKDIPFEAAVLAHVPDRVLGDLDVVRAGLLRLLGPVGARQERRGRPARIMHYHSRADRLFVSREHQVKWERPDVLVRPMNLANVRDFLHTHSASWAAKVHVPTLSVVSAPDRVVRHASSLKVHEALAGHKALLEHRGGHACFRDLDADAVDSATVGWFERHLGGK